MIGCDGPTLTVRIFSKVTPNQITLLHGDTDSHTSIVLAQLILAERYNRNVPLVPLTKNDAPETMLLIGDKVVNAAPNKNIYPYQMDLGEEWKNLTGLPFVFAMWMMPRDATDVALAKRLADARQQGAQMTETLLDRHCTEKQWPRELAHRYFTEYLQYEVTERAKTGLAKFYELAQNRRLLNIRRTAEYLGF